MSTQTKSSGGGGRNQKKSNQSGANTGGGGDSVSNKKTDVKTEKEKPQPKPTAEQIRIAQITDINSGSEDPKMREKVATLIEMTQRSEEEVCCALYECDNNLEKAVVFLLETLPVGAFETSSKKKKNRVASTNNNNNESGDGEWVDSNANNDKQREKSRNRSSTRGGRGGSDSRGWRGREVRENERNSSEFPKSVGSDRIDRDNNRGERGERVEGGGWRGSRGRGRGGFGGRGGRGGRMGPRGTRDDRGGRRNDFHSRNEPQQEVDTWDNTIAENAEKQQQDDAWGDWDNEEYVGSLKESKVFAPSGLQTATAASLVAGTASVGELTAPPGLEQHLSQVQLTAEDLVQQYNTTVVSSTATSASVGGVNVNSVQFPDIHTANPTSTAAQHLRGLNSLDAAAAAAAQQLKSATLSAEQSQYFSSLQSQQQQQPQQQQLQQNAYQQNSTVANVAAAVQYPTNYGNVFGDQHQQSQPVRRARAKVPPPSKIPSSAVEMPGDALTNIYLDVQFGGLDFVADVESFDTLTEKFQTAAAIDQQQQQQSVVQQQQDLNSNSNDYQSNKLSSSGLQTSQIGDNLTSNYSQRTSGNVQQQQQQSGNVNSTNSINQSNNLVDHHVSGSKSDPYSNHQSSVSASSAGGYQSSYNSNASSQKSSYQSNSAGGQSAYGNSGYSNSQVPSGNAYQPSSNSYNSYNQSSVNSYQQQASVTGVGSSSGNQVSNSSSQNIPVGGNNSSVNNSGSSTNTGYLSNQYQSNQTPSAFQTQQTAYQNSQSVYGSSGLTNNSGYSGSTNTSTSQYSNFTSSKLKEPSSTASSTHSHYESVSTPASGVVSSNTPSSVSSSAVTSLQNSLVSSNKNTTSSASSSVSASGIISNTNSVGVGGGVTGVSGSNSNSNSTNSTNKSNPSSGSGMVPNIQMVSQYIQTGMPYYQQPAAVYSYEEFQMMQQRMPHVAQYYDINYPPTSLSAAGVRDASLGSVAYSTMTDGRFARTDNNSSPVSNVSSTSQQAGSSGPMLNVPYYFYGGNMMPGGFQYGTPAIYPQQMATANATSGGQFKPSYNSGYGSATANYDALSQATQDYTKGAYPGSSVSQQSKNQTGGVNNPQQTASASEMSSSMYGKSHVALNKVNSYEKQSFHSGTPPPFNLTGTQTAGAASAQPYGMYIQPMPAAHHNINMHQPMHQDTNSTGQRQQSSSQNKSAAKQGYSPSYWTAQN